MGRRMGLCRDAPHVAEQDERELSCGPGWRRVSCSTRANENIDRLLRFADARALRSLLSKDDSFVYRLRDHQVRTAVALQLARKVYVLFEFVDESRCIEPVALENDVAAAVRALPPSKSATVATTSTSSPSPAPARRMAAPVDIAPEPWEAVGDKDFVANIDHDIQAAVLKAASAHGVPFCEVCEKANQFKKAALESNLDAEA